MLMLAHDAVGTRTFVAEVVHYNSHRAGIHAHPCADAREGPYLLGADGQRIEFSCTARSGAPLLDGRERVRRR